MVSEIVKDIDNGSGPVKTEEMYIEELIDKVNEIIRWINEQDN